MTTSARLLAASPLAWVLDSVKVLTINGPQRFEPYGYQARLLADRSPRVLVLCRAWAAKVVTNVDGALYICMSTKEWPVVSRVLEEAGAHGSTRSSGARTVSCSGTRYLKHT